jgi:hypothetical protein
VQAKLSRDTGRLELLDAATGDLWERIAHGDDDALNPGGYDRFGARRRLAVMAARFERDVHRRACKALTSRSECIDLSMRAAKSLMPAFADDLAAANDHAADHGVRLDITLPAARKLQRTEHVAGVVGRRCH